MVLVKQKMNEQQQLAVDALEGAMLILAGAGTGKTTVIVQRIANMVRHGIAPKSILAVTFTNKAAAEMRERIGVAVGENAAKEMTISTFHAFCIRLLHHHIDLLGYSRNFGIAQESYRRGLITEIINQGGQSRISGDADFWLHEIGMAKAAARMPEDIRAEGYATSVEVADVYETYQNRMRQMDLLDFDDLLCLTVQLWKQHPEVLEDCQKIYRYIMVDEFQDTNDVQMQLVSMLGKAHGNVAVVGDDDQSIYGWRGANIRNIQDFQKSFPGAQLLRLEQNYRSTNTILKAANGVISRNPQRLGKMLWSENGDGEKIQLVRLNDENAEAQFIADYLKDRGESGKWKDFAVLFRSNQQARLLEEAVRKVQIPYVMVGTQSFYQTKEILDAIAYLQAVNNIHDDLSFLRIVNVPPRGIGDTAIERLRQQREIHHKSLQELAKSDFVLNNLPAGAAASLRSLLGIFEQCREQFRAGCDLAEIARTLYRDTGYLNGMLAIYRKREDAEKRQDNLYEFINSMQDFQNRNPGGRLTDFLEYVSLFDSSDNRQSSDKEETGNAVTFMTIHAAKGLEFDNVIICGMEKNLFPHKRAMEEGNETEERRLFYVGITRAKKHLVLTFASHRREKNVPVSRLPSMFLDEISGDCVELVKSEDMFRVVSGNELAKEFENLFG